MIGISKLFNFQRGAVDWLLDQLHSSFSKTVLKLKAPTGSGKTIILLSLIKEYFQIHPNTAFIWFCPGKGNLEEQSMHKMEQFLPGYSAMTLLEALSNGFSAKSVTFVNWELVTKKGNKAITDSEKRNLFDAIRLAHLEGREFIVIIDEEHSNNTKKADTVIQAFSPKHIVRASATTSSTKSAEFYEISESDVIEEELITKSLILNEDVDGKFADAETEYKYLLELANEKRLLMAKHYKDENLKIHPLVLIQLPDKSKDPEETLKRDVIQYLAEMDYSIGNHLVAVWLTDEKENLDGIESNEAEPVFLIMKQAVATGWDCPRAKILVKLRENMGEVFTIQTVGRLRRMPLQHFHSHESLNHSYIYTFDDKFKQGLLEQENAVILKRYFLKDEFDSVSLPSEKRFGRATSANRENVLATFYAHMVSKYHLEERDYQHNQRNLSTGGYVFLGNLKRTEFFTGEVSLISEMDVDHLQKKEAFQPVQTHSDGRTLMHIINSIASKTKLENETVRLIMRRLFFQSTKRKFRLLQLTNVEFYAFVINNAEQLTVDWYETVQKTNDQGTLDLRSGADVVTFNFPKEQMYQIDPETKKVIMLPINVYRDYSSETFIARSNPEQLLERWMNAHLDRVKWYYKNGDHGSIYLSIVYERSIGDFREFYPDYILETSDEKVWLLETKGGENLSGGNRNIDPYSASKFNALKRFAVKYDYGWGFVREIGQDLFVNNTNYTESMQSEEWKPIEDILK